METDTSQITEKSLISRLALGTVQFGVDYGINNATGKIPETDVQKILEYAHLSGIDTLDTAYGYGNSEEVIGKSLGNLHIDFNIISKYPLTDDKKVSLIDVFHESIKRLKIDTLYGYMFHNYQAFEKNPDNIEILYKLRYEGLIKKIGFSLYYTKELDTILNNKIKFDLIQIPYSLFDQRFEEYFPKLKKLGVEIHTRSVFLQGLVFKKTVELKNNFGKIKNKIETLNRLAEELDTNVSSLCLNFALFNELIDKVVIGVDNIFNLKESIEHVNENRKVQGIYRELKDLIEHDEQIILPINWS